MVPQIIRVAGVGLSGLALGYGVETVTPMEQLLDTVRQRDLRENPYFSDARVRALEAELEKPGEQDLLVKRFKVMADLGWEYMNQGEAEKGIALLETLHANYRRLGASDLATASTAYALGMAYFRLGESENCCAINAAESCILPLRGEAIHRVRRGSERAAECFEEAIELGRGDHALVLKSTWFLNLAAMTLGEFPGGAPPEHRLPVKPFAGTAEPPRFQNIAGKLGLARENLAGGAVAEDFDGDGDLDLVTSTWDSSGGMSYQENLGDGRFLDRSEDAGLARSLGGLNLVHADYDNDGDVDIYVLRGAWLGTRGDVPNSLLQNQGDATFVDVTLESGLGEPHYPTQTAAWADYDNDGDLDLFVGNESVGNTTAPCQLFQNDGRGRFVDVANAAGVTNLRFTKGVAWGDFDADRWPDLAVSNFREPNRLFRNNRDGTFTDVAPETGTELPLKSFPVWTWDFDNDGHLDLFISSYSGSVESYVVELLGKVPPGVEHSGHFRGNGQWGFENVADAQGLGAPMLTMGCGVGDLDNDGWLDFYLGTGEPDVAVVIPNRLYENLGGTGFHDATLSSGLAHLQKGHAVAFADFDQDGDLDVFEQMGGARLVDAFRDALFENTGRPKTHWIDVQLVGTESNRSAIGARIKLVVPDGNGAQRSIFRHIGSGTSFGGNPLRQHIGVGDATEIVELEVFWPTTGRTDRFETVAVDQRVIVTEAAPDYQPVTLKPVRLGGN